MSSGFLTFLGWAWTVLAGLTALGALMAGSVSATFALIVSGAASMPPLWQRLRERGVTVPTGARFATGLIALGAGSIWMQPGAPTGAQAEAQPTADKPKDPVAEQLAVTTKKIPTDAISLMERDQYPKMYAKLGKAQFENANALTRWAAIAAAESDACPAVSVIGVSDTSTRKAVQWFVDCSNEERFMISEEQARAARDQYDPAADPEVRSAAEQVAVAEPKSARWKGFSEPVAISACDEVVKASAVNRGSVDIAWTWDTSKDDETGRVTFERNFDAENAFGGTISSRYRCVVDADAGTMVSLSIRELTGWRKLL